MHTKFFDNLISWFGVQNHSFTNRKICANGAFKLILNHKIDIEIKLNSIQILGQTFRRWSRCLPRQDNSKITWIWIWLNNERSWNLRFEHKINACVLQEVRRGWLNDCFDKLWAKLLMRKSYESILVWEDSEKVWCFLQWHLADINSHVFLLKWLQLLTVQNIALVC